METINYEQEIGRLNRELHKADLQIGRLRAEIKELKSKLELATRPRFSNG